MSVVAKVSSDISDLTLSATSCAQLRAGIATVLQPLVRGDCVGVMSAKPGCSYQATMIGTAVEPFRSQAWRYTLECPRKIVMRLNTGFVRSTEIDPETLSRLAFQREYFAPQGIKVIVARCWIVDDQFFCVGAGRQKMDFSDSEVQLLDSISSQLAVAMRMSERLAQDTEASFAAVCESYDLSHRQREIAHLLARGLRNAEIATLLHLQTNTVRNYIAELFRRTRVSNRAELTYLMNTQSYKEDPSARGARELLKWLRQSKQLAGT